MKTITLDDAAYERLKSWKRGPKDSFSKVVKRVVPQPGTLAAFAGFAEANRTDRMPGNDKMEKAIEQQSPVKEDPWTS
jgi:predicted CopG family antitoxin